MLTTERMPPAPVDIEMRLVDFVDFSTPVLACRDKSRAQVRRSESDIFAGGVGEGDADIWAALSPAAVAEKARQVVLDLADVNEREIRRRLLDKFHSAIENGGAVPPSDEELLEQQLDLVLVRNPALLREAWRRMRLRDVVRTSAPQLQEIVSELPLEPARRNVFGVFPAGMNGDEEQIARLLDAHPRVRWWHRNRSDHRQPDAVGLYAWDEGDGFFPDFVLALEGRETPDGIALLEVKGPMLWSERKEVEKADAIHPDYGRTYMVGRRKGDKEFRFLRPLQGRLEQEAVFDIERLRWA